jgi:hypothetical protein
MTDKDTMRRTIGRLKARVDVLERECAQMSEELGLPPTIRPAEGELRRMQQALGREIKLEAGLRRILELADDEKLMFIAVMAAEVLDEVYP